MLLKAALGARRFVESVRREDGIYQIDDWPRARGKRGGRVRRINSAVGRLRVSERLMMGFLDPVEDALFLTAGLRKMGIPASFHLGRELVPTTPPAGFYAWVEYGGEVLSTSLPVHETYIEVHRSEQG
ncbi:hypothetical protein ABTZ59_29020 [Streptomyces sp. NPDC094034]|uniref:hypothetical protein n=1 Tax=Streptomyces sp. NPDC094034 TaxID=3155309 RepID=UPI00332602C0